MSNQTPFIAISEITDEIYIVLGGDKYLVTEQCVNAVINTGRALPIDTQKEN